MCTIGIMVSHFKFIYTVYRFLREMFCNIKSPQEFSSQVYHAKVVATNSNCDGAVHLKQSVYPVLSHSATFHTKWPPNSSDCLWTIVGDEDCEPQITCNINIPLYLHNLNCSRDFVQITDGAAGSMKFCGTVSIGSIRASKDLRDIFVVLKSSKNMQEDGTGQVTCLVKCGKGPATWRLPKVLERKFVNDCNCGVEQKSTKSVRSVDIETEDAIRPTRYVIP